MSVCVSPLLSWDPAHLELLDLPGQGRVCSHVLEERRLEANPQVGLLSVTVFLMNRRTKSTT